MKTIEIPETVEESMAILRKLYPSMRRTASTAIIRSGAKRTVFGCLCGSEHTASTDWNGREAKHVTDWQREHVRCCIDLATGHLTGHDIALHFGR